MLKTYSDNAEIFIGQNAGDSIYKSIKNSKKSIKILSPYISADYIDLLLDATEKNLDVLLITGSDMANNRAQKQIYRKIIIQNQHVNERMKKIRLIGMIITFLGFVAALGGGYWAFKNTAFDYKWALTAVGFLIFFFIFFKKVRIFNYSYKTKFNFGVLVSPYDQQIDPDQYFVHSKIFIIDDKVAYVGSVNFTKKAFRKNYECCVKITGEEAVSKISMEISNLENLENTYFRIINEVGKSIFPEPIN